jgi:tetraacyldisaccharide 4'-kinase
MAKKVNPLLNALVLRPLSAIYGLVTGARNKMFDCGLLSQRRFDIPVLVVGNIAVGGTGKTPHTEYLVERLRYRYNIGVLSRGYNRATKGFVLATSKTAAREIGDEPYQIYRKYGRDVMVAVCEDRCKGIEEMRRVDPNLNLIILDDAFQHRYVQPSLSIVLTEYSRPVFKDRLMPAGRLRESPDALQRADIVVVTKCPDTLQPLDYSLMARDLKLLAYQKLYFTQYSYGPLHPVFDDDPDQPVPNLSALGPDDTVVALAGVANPRPFVRHIKQSGVNVKTLIFRDHHNFVRDDIVRLVEKIKSAKNPASTIVVTTEKDAMRLRGFKNMRPGLRRRLFYLPIQVEFIRTGKLENPTSSNSDFDSTVISLLSQAEKKLK